MKLKSEFIAHSYGGESLLVPTAEADFSGLVQGNRSFGAILSYLETDITEQEVVERMSERFDAPREVLAADVAKVLKSLREIGALDE